MKQLIARQLNSFAAMFPRLIERGSIEAGFNCCGGKALHWFPRLIERGSIEATPFTSTLTTATVFPRLIERGSIEALVADFLTEVAKGTFPRLIERGSIEAWTRCGKCYIYFRGFHA